MVCSAPTCGPELETARQSLPANLSSIEFTNSANYSRSDHHDVRTRRPEGRFPDSPTQPPLPRLAGNSDHHAAPAALLFLGLSRGANSPRVRSATGSGGVYLP